jgi:outer membrane lipoprotein carrier protein
VSAQRAICLLQGVALCLALASGARGDGDAGPGGAAGPKAPSPCVARTVAAVQKRYEAVDDLSAHFTQTTRAASLGGGGSPPTRSSGRVTFAKPGRMRWEYEEPEKSLVVSDGKILWLYDPAFGEAQRLPVGGAFLSGAAIQFLLGEGDMLREFEVTELACQDERVELELVPREPASYEKLRIVANPSSGDISRTVVVDLLGNVTEIEFTDLKVDQKPPDDRFRFVPPEGVKVVDLAG